MAKRKTLLLAVLLATVVLCALLCAALLPSATPAQAAEYEYVLSTRKATATSETPQLLVAQYNGIYYAMVASSASATTSKKVEIADNKITSAVDSKMLWTVEEISNYRVIKNVDTGTYLVLTTWGSTSLGSTGTQVYKDESAINGTGSLNDYYVYITSTSAQSSKNNSSTFAVYEQTAKQASATEKTITFAKGNDAATGTMADAKWDTANGDYTLPECTFKYEFYKFAGWKVNGAGDVLAAGATVTIAEDTQLVAQWTENWYNVTLQMADQTDSLQKAEKGKPINLGNNTKYWGADSTPSGKMFSHWTSNGTDKITGNYTPTEDVTLTAVFADAISITFDGNGGTMSSSYANGAVAAANGTYKLPSYASSCSRTNYELVGYHCSLHDEVHALGSTCQLGTENITYTAQWRYEGYTLTFKVAGQDDIVKLVEKTERNWNETTTYTIDVANPTKANADFLGWYLDGNTDKLWKKDETMTTAQLQALTGRQGLFVAQFKEKEMITVTYHFKGQTVSDQWEKGKYTLVKAIANVFPNWQEGITDPTFKGWSLNEDLSGELIGSVNKAFNTNVDLYAVVKSQITITFDYGFKANPGDASNKTTTIKGVAGAEIFVPYPSNDSGVPERTGYTLVGWATTEGGDIAYAAEKGVKFTIQTACTLYAVWDYNFYVVTIKLSGQTEALGTALVAKNRSGSTKFTIGTLKDAQGALVTSWEALNSAHKDAVWTLVKGEDRRDCTLTDEITLTADANFEVRLTNHLYKITVSWVGGTLATIEQAYDTDVTAPATDKAGYEFKGFFLNNEEGGAYTFDKMPGANITVWAKYEALDSTLTFDTAGGSAIASITAKTGTKVNRPADPTKEGYTFDKWLLNGVAVAWQVEDGTSSDPKYYVSMPGGNNTFVAKWNITAEGLAALKEAKLSELNAYAQQNGVAVPENGIEDAITEQAVLDAFTAAKAAVDQAKADKDAAAALAAAKTSAKAEVAAKATEAGVTAPSTEAIDSATTLDAVAAAKQAALAKIAADKADKDAAESASAARVKAAKDAVAALAGKKGSDLRDAIKAVDTALAALSQAEKQQVDLTSSNAAKTAYAAYVQQINADLDVAESFGLSASALAVAASASALAALAFVLKRRIW